MFDGVQHQRSFGSASVVFADGRLQHLWQSGSAKAMLPRTHRKAPEIVFLNTSGGLTAGDRLDYGVTVCAGMPVQATTQTAERAYRADGEAAQVQVRMTVGKGASLDWLPQETILFQGAALERVTEVDLDDDAHFLGVETIVLGRAAMGEVVTQASLGDRRIVRRNGRPLLVDPMRLDAGALSRGADAALWNGARAASVLLLVGRGADAALAPIRAALDQPGVSAAASARDGLLVVRAMASDGWPLRRQMIRLIEILRPGALPRVWQG
ncbi:urease accessory protein UreD [Paracoccus sp. TK19116]|uniref:Urease accessory protein UreD n=1 Tax=Paracoccus albicereus TaxID=2922394 RepID=A0ABT1MRC0_9RHOB|nr:urease accessory protein UreD [Paracoccus albicereus]MCQ0970264.1 urease accessory protein UreD [Paracoccus albicereus]